MEPTPCGTSNRCIYIELCFDNCGILNYILSAQLRLFDLLSLRRLRVCLPFRSKGYLAYSRNSQVEDILVFLHWPAGSYRKHPSRTYALVRILSETLCQ